MRRPVAHWIMPGAERTECGRSIPPRLVHRDWPRCKTCERVRAATGAGYFVTYINGWSRQRFESPNSSSATTYAFRFTPSTGPQEGASE